MVVASNPKSWLPDQRLDPSLGILAFEVAAAMTRLLSLHRTLSDDNILTLRSDAMRSKGVAYLNSTDQAFLFRLACAEIMVDLDRTMAAVIRLGDRCRGPRACGLIRAYADIKAGSGDLRMALRGAEKTMRRMEKCISSTSRLYDEMEALGELEAEERRILQLLYGGRDSGPIPLQKPLPVAALSRDGAEAELKLRRHRVRRLKEESLWGQSFDKAVVLMARAACAILARVCIVFGAFVPGLPPIPAPDCGDNGFLRFAPAQLRTTIYPWLPGKHSSGPLERRRPTAVGREMALWNSCPVVGSAKASEEEAGTNWGRMLLPPDRTVGGSGMAGRYATVVELAERLLQMREDGEVMGVKERRLEAAAREELYELLPAGLRAAVKGKLRDWWRQDAGPLDGSLAEGWRVAAGRIMEWLAPMARDTEAWQAERNMDRRQRFDPRPRMLLLQTLYFSDREKTEAAITEVLVALSLVGWYEERRRPSVRI